MPTVVASGQNAYVSFTDALGAAELVTAQGQFTDWTPNAEDVGVDDVAMANGQTYKFIYRTDYTASFSIVAIPASVMPVALRLKRWLECGGQVVVATQDAQGNTYTCLIAPKAKIKFAYDPTFLEYTMTLAVLNTSPVPMTCLYQPSAGTGYTLAVSPPSLAIVAGTGAVPLSAVVTDSAGNPVQLPVTWSSTASAVASVLSSGQETATVTAVTAGSCEVIASIGSLTVTIPVTVSINNTVAAVLLSPSTLAFTATTYTGTPDVGVSGVPSQTVTATLLNSANVILAYAPGALDWTCTNAEFALVDNLDGTATVTANAGGQTGVVKATNPGTGISSSITVTSVASAGAVALVPQQSQITLTAVGQQVTVPLTSIDQYGVAVS